MIVISDNDVLKKLACCNLYDEFLQAFNVSLKDVFILNTAKPVLLKRKRKQIDEESLQRLTTFLDAVQVIATVPDPDEQAALTEQQNIDAGEAVLFSVTHQTEGSLLATGDKRSLESLAKANDEVCRRLCEKLAGKVVCFEQIVLRIIDSQTFEAVRDKLISGRECDKALAIVLGSGLDATELVVRDGLVSYINHLRTNSATLLIDH